MKIQHTEKYQNYLSSDAWKSIKTKVISRATCKCEGCGESERTLDVHHLTYDRVGMELMTDLVAFCAYCHMKAHSMVEPSIWNEYLKNDTEEPKNISEMTKEELSVHRMRSI